MSASNDLAVEMLRVTKKFGTTTVLHDITLSFKRGTATAIVGPSGSGKTTIIRCINHLIPIDAGEIRIEGELLGYERMTDGQLRELPEKKFCRERAKIGMVFQHFNLFSNMNVLANVMEAPITVKRMDHESAKAKAVAALEQVGLAARHSAYPLQLSGGQQQRVAIARALAMDPPIMLFDEPTSMLDPELVEEVLEVMRALAKSGRTIIFVTHEIEFARDACDTLVFMDEGKVVEAGPPHDVIRSPKNERTRMFLKKVS
ncbi:MAG: polar amino acid transport system ATP-binding protein [Variibacter sp.]|nr:polar amino acid transport system ATP-binding protein [Variibacter sp.]